MPYLTYYHLCKRYGYERGLNAGRLRRLARTKSRSVKGSPCGWTILAPSTGCRWPSGTCSQLPEGVSGTGAPATLQRLLLGRQSQTLLLQQLLHRRQV